MNAVMALAQRDVLKLFRDPVRMVSTFIFPLIFIGILGGSLKAGFGNAAGFDFLAFTFTGVLAQTLWQSSAMGVISLIEDRENDFSQEIFVSPISRYAIVFGKILGESLVALPQGIAIVIFGFLVGIPLGLATLGALTVVAIVVCLSGAAFGLLVMANLRSQRAANQVFPFIMLPQFFLAGIFNPLKNLPWFLDWLSKISPMRYAVDLMRDAFYAGSPEYDKTVLADLTTNLGILAVLFAAFMVLGTALFVRAERNR